MLGNIVTGTSIFAPAGMLNELAAELGVTVRVAGLLVTFGAVVLCIGSPVMALESGAPAQLCCAVVSQPALRGRVMALYMTIVMGGTPIGSPITA